METSGVEDLKSMALFAELNPEPVIRFDKKGVVIRANQAALEAFGIENLEGKDISDVLTDIGNIDMVDFIQMNRIQKLQITLGERVYRFMLRGIEEHGVCQIYGSDVTEKYRAQQKAESMALFAELNPEPVLRFDFTGKILQANQAANEAFNRDNLTDMNIIDFMPELSAFHIPDFIKENKIESLEITFNNRILNFQLRGINSLKVCQIYGTDITKRVLAEREVIQKQKSITDSIRYASLIQNAVLPNPKILEQYTSEHFVLFQPRDIVSGDFYWFAERENKLVIAAADCTGHGVPGAFMSMLGISFLNEIVHTTHCCAEKILNQLRDKVITTLSQSGKQSNDGMDISLLIVDKQNSSVQFAGAYNSIYLIRDAKLNEFKADRMPIGKYHRENVAFSSQSFDYKKGDTVYLLSDGFPDQFSSSLNKKYTRKQFKHFILKNNSESMQIQKSLLKNEFDNWREEEKQLDDVLVIGARF